MLQLSSSKIACLSRVSPKRKSADANTALRISGSRQMADSYSFLACKYGKYIYDLPKCTII
jgi:hypothetical protein